jgi:hypothetical protein
MDLRESMLAAADDAPLSTSTVDVDEIVRTDRRARASRFFGAGSVALAAAVAVALTVPALAGGRGHDVGTPTAVGPPVTAAPSSAGEHTPDTARLKLTAAELMSSSKGGGWLLAFRNLDVHLAADGNPCTLAPGDTAGKGGAPAPEDTCSKLDRKGETVWVRRWGYNADLRPWMSPDSTIVEIFVHRGDRVMSLGISNTYPMKGSKPGTMLGGKFDVSDEELAKFAAMIDFPDS